MYRSLGAVWLRLWMFFLKIVDAQRAELDGAAQPMLLPARPQHPGRFRPGQRPVPGEAILADARNERGRVELEAQGAGRNTRMAASVPDRLARVATNSRSSSGTNSEVRAPGRVGTRASGW